MENYQQVCSYICVPLFPWISGEDHAMVVYRDMSYPSYSIPKDKCITVYSTSPLLVSSLAIAKYYSS